LRYNTRAENELENYGPDVAYEWILKKYEKEVFAWLDKNKISESGKVIIISGSCAGTRLSLRYLPPS
jgi:hypothetical protein